MILGSIIYLVVTVLAGIILSFFAVTFRSTKKRGDGNPYIAVIFCFFLTIFGPFIFTEAITALYLKPMEPAIMKAYRAAPITAKLHYVRLTWYTGDKAKAIVVGEERESWGGTDRPIIGVDLKKTGNSWEALSFTVLYSDRLNKDSLVIPPYR